MANNEIFGSAERLSVAVTNPAVPAAGNPVRYGFATGVALDNEGAGGNVAANTSVDFGMRVWLLPVTDFVAGGGGILVGDTLFYSDGAPGTITNNPAGTFFGIALQAVGNGLTATIRVLHMASPGSGTIGAGTIATANLAAGLLSADAPGRAKMAADYFNAATVLTKFDANCLDTANLLLMLLADGVTNAVLLQAVLDGAFQADAPTRALFADYIWPELKLALASLTGNVVALNATGNAIGSIPVYHRFTIPDVGAPTDYSILLTHKTLITNWWIQNTGAGAHNTDDTINLKNVAASLSGAVPKTNVVNGLIRPATLDSTACLVTAGTNLTVTATKATNIACIVHVQGVRSA
jgi:hypothetical protein